MALRFVRCESVLYFYLTSYPTQRRYQVKVRAQAQELAQKTREMTRRQRGDVRVGLWSPVKSPSDRIESDRVGTSSIGYSQSATSVIESFTTKPYLVHLFVASLFILADVMPPGARRCSMWGT